MMFFCACYSRISDRAVWDERNGFGNGNRFHSEGPFVIKWLFTAIRKAIFDLNQTSAKQEAI